MNLLPLYRDHPDLAEVIAGPPVHLAACHDCGQRFPRDKLYHYGSIEVCPICFGSRQDAAWEEWLDRLAKEGRE